MQGVAPLVQGLIWLCLQHAKRKALCTKRKQQQTKVYANGMRGRGGQFLPQASNRTWYHLPHGSDFRLAKSTGERGL